jgi:carbamate kinase
MKRKIIVIALGGNAILQPGQIGSIKQQFENINNVCKHLTKIISWRQYDMVITHGNGPQVGNMLLQSELACGVTPQLPLDVCGAATQGTIGYLIQQTLANHLRLAGLPYNITTIITQVIVEQDDPAFKNPNKPIGPFYDLEQIQQLKKNGWHLIEDSHRGYRRVVPSPKPLKIQETRIIKNMLDTGEIVIAVGGGGIPVIRDNDRSLHGIEAVIDKDLSAATLAIDIEADILLILTDVEKVLVNFGHPNEFGIDRMTTSEAEHFIREGIFGEGSMKPKVEAGINFVRAGGGKAIITELNKAVEALEGRTGTIIIP